MSNNTERCITWLGTSPSLDAVKAKHNDVLAHIEKWGEEHPKYADYLNVEMALFDHIHNSTFVENEGESNPDLPKKPLEETATINKDEHAGGFDSSNLGLPSTKGVLDQSDNGASIAELKLDLSGLDSGGDVAVYENKDEKDSAFGHLMKEFGVNKVVTCRRTFQ